MYTCIEPWNERTIKLIALQQDGKFGDDAVRIFASICVTSRP